ncbi:hypothetical protein GCM10028806_35710 [Spirosoma terrae]
MLSYLYKRVSLIEDAIKELYVARLAKISVRFQGYACPLPDDESWQTKPNLLLDNRLQNWHDT